jgi:hypothetical protein
MYMMKVKAIERDGEIERERERLKTESPPLLEDLAASAA